MKLILLFVFFWIPTSEINLIAYVQVGKSMEQIEAISKVLPDLTYLDRDSSLTMSIKTLRPYYCLSLHYEIGHSHRKVTYHSDSDRNCHATTFQVFPKELKEVMADMDKHYKRSAHIGCIAYWQMEGKSYASLTKRQDKDEYQLFFTHGKGF